MMIDISDYKDELYGILMQSFDQYSRFSFLYKGPREWDKSDERTQFGNLSVDSTKVISKKERLLFLRYDVRITNGDRLCSFILGNALMLYGRFSRSFREKLINKERIRGIATFSKRNKEYLPASAAVIILDNRSYGTWFTTVSQINELISLFCGDVREDEKTFFSEAVSADNLLPEHYNEANSIMEETLDGDQLKKLEDVAEVIAPKSARREDYRSEGIPFLRSRDIKNGKICKPEVYISIDGAMKFPHNMLQVGDILLTKHFGQNKIALVTEEDLPAMASGMLYIIRPFEISERYLYRYLTSTTGKEVFEKQIKKIQRGTAVPTITLADLKKIKIPVFDESTMQIFENMKISSKQDTERMYKRLLMYSKAFSENNLEEKVVRDLIVAGWEEKSILRAYEIDLSSNGMRVKWRPDLCYQLKDGRQVLIEIKTDLRKINKDWIIAVNQILYGSVNYIFILTTGYYYEVHASGIKQSLKKPSPPTIDEIIMWEKEAR